MKTTTPMIPHSVTASSNACFFSCVRHRSTSTIIVHYIWCQPFCSAVWILSERLCFPTFVHYFLPTMHSDFECTTDVGPVPNGTLNPHCLPLSPHFRYVMPLWLLAKHLMHMVHLSGNTSVVSKSSSDWLDYTGFLGDVCSLMLSVNRCRGAKLPRERKKPSCLQMWRRMLIRVDWTLDFQKYVKYLKLATCNLSNTFESFTHRFVIAHYCKLHTVPLSTFLLFFLCCRYTWDNEIIYFVSFCLLSGNKSGK